MKRITILLAVVALACADAQAQSLLKKLGKAVEKAAQAVDKTVGDVLGTSPDEAAAEQSAPAAEQAAAPAAQAAQPAANIITAAGAGPFKLGAIKPGKVGAYTVENVSDDWNGDYVSVKNAAGEEAIAYFPPDYMEIFSPDFQLENGIRAGMTIGELLQIMGPAWTPEIDEGWNDSGRTIEFSKNIGLNSSDLTPGAKAKWDAAYAKGTDFQLKITDFDPAGKIWTIRVKK